MRLITFLMVLVAMLPAAQAAVSVETFTCNGMSGTVVVENGASFSCQASIRNEDTQNSANIGSVSLLAQGSWAEKTSYGGTGFSTTLGAGASTSVTFSGIKAVAPGAANKFQSVQIDTSADTFVANTNVNVIAFKSLSVTAPSAAGEGTEFDVQATVIAGGDLGSVTLTWSGTGCSVAAGHAALKDLGSLAHNTEGTRSWRILQGSSDCVMAVRASGTTSSVATSKTKSATVTFSGGSPSASAGSTSSGGGGGGGGSAAETKEVKTVTAVPGMQSAASFSATSIKSVILEVFRSQDVKITVAKLDAPPAAASSLSGTAYQFIEINATVEQPDVKAAVIRFNVSKPWLAERSFTAGDVVLKRFAGGWQSLPTTGLGENANEAAYEASTPGFSVFAVVAEQHAASKCGDGVCDAGETCPADCMVSTPCGNGKREGSEVCDGSDLGGKSCQTQGYDSGALACKKDCTFDTSRCSIPPGQRRREPESQQQGAAEIVALVVIGVVAGLAYWHYHKAPPKPFAYRYAPNPRRAARRRKT